mmetsp:Transcript_10117/g.8637  ORF Transcript_10117/g.8637 Transcript_10117/m.8637 type:complete len:80 (+) Transcript_10117:305-544(+)
MESLKIFKEIKHYVLLGLEKGLEGLDELIYERTKESEVKLEKIWMRFERLGKSYAQMHKKIEELKAENKKLIADKALSI